MDNFIWASQTDEFKQFVKEAINSNTSQPISTISRIEPVNINLYRADFLGSNDWYMFSQGAYAAGGNIGVSALNFVEGHFYYGNLRLAFDPSGTASGQMYASLLMPGSPYYETILARMQWTSAPEQDIVSEYHNGALFADLRLNCDQADALFHGHFTGVRVIGA